MQFKVIYIHLESVRTNVTVITSGFGGGGLYSIFVTMKQDEMDKNVDFSNGLKNLESMNTY